MVKIIGIGEYAVSSNESHSIKTFALGSCVALVVYCKGIKKLGMVHAALPDSSLIKESSAGYKAGYFADIAVPLLFSKLMGGYSNYNKDYKVMLFGGALSNNEKDIFNIGQRNIKKIKEILTKNNIPYDSTNTGGNYSWTVEVDVKTGKPIISLYYMK